MKLRERSGGGGGMAGGLL